MITVVGASGCIGARVTTQLLKEGFLVKAIVFRPDSKTAVDRLGVTECNVVSSLHKHTLYETFDGEILETFSSFMND